MVQFEVYIFSFKEKGAITSYIYIKKCHSVIFIHSPEIFVKAWIILVQAAILLIQGVITLGPY